jgi:hypothetical protein
MPGAKGLLVMEESDRSECERIVRSRGTAVSIARRAQMLVLAASGFSNRQIALELEVNAHVVHQRSSQKMVRAHRLVSFHYTPTHASWVNLIECFFSILTRQGLQQAGSL